MSDANYNGNVDNVRELFGYKDESGNGVEGTEELRQYDLNQDGVINLLLTDEIRPCQIKTTDSSFAIILDILAGSCARSPL